MIKIIGALLNLAIFSLLIWVVLTVIIGAGLTYFQCVGIMLLTEIIFTRIHLFRDLDD